MNNIKQINGNRNNGKMNGKSSKIFETKYK